MAVPIWVRQSLSCLFTKKRRSRDTGNRSTKLHFEVLEERVNPGGIGATLYVANAALLSSTTPGASTTWTPGANFAGFNTVNGLTFDTNAFTDLAFKLLQRDSLPLGCCLNDLRIEWVQFAVIRNVELNRRA